MFLETLLTIAGGSLGLVAFKAEIQVWAAFLSIYLLSVFDHLRKGIHVSLIEMQEMEVIILHRNSINA